MGGATGRGGRARCAASFTRVCVSVYMYACTQLAYLLSQQRQSKPPPSPHSPSRAISSFMNGFPCAGKQTRANHAFADIRLRKYQ